MKTLLLDAIFLKKNTVFDFNNKSSVELILEEAKKNGFDRFIFIQFYEQSNLPDEVSVVTINSRKPADILKAIFDVTINSEFVVIVDADSPFYDAVFINNMIDRHSKYLADYTYALGYPDGISPVVIKRDIIKELIELVKNDDVEKEDYLFYSISKEINSFDIETFVAPFDVRLYRVSFGCKDEGERVLTKAFYDMFGNNISYDKVVEYIKNNLDQLYTIPYFIILELTNFSSVKNTYYPCDFEKSCIDKEFAKNIVEYFSHLNDNIYILLGGVGEPLEHSDFFDILNTVLSNNAKAIIETDGYLLNEEFLGRLSSLNKDNIIFVLRYDAYSDEVYSKVHPEADFNKVKQAYALLKNSGFKVYRQIIRMNENESDIENFVKNKDMDDIIIRKFSTFCGVLQDKKVVDLAPLKRIPCFHLRREVFIKSDNTFSPCFYSRSKEIIASIKNIDISDIVKKMKILYKDNALARYLDCCKECDDYYTFNF